MIFYHDDQETFSDQNYLFQRAFDCRYTVFNGLTVEEMTLFIQKLQQHLTLKGLTAI